MKSLWNKIKTPIKVGALATILSLVPLKSLAQKSANITQKGKIKAGISYNLFSNEYLSKEYKNLVLIHGGYEKNLSNMLNLGLDISFGTKKEVDTQLPYKLIYFSANMELICGIKDNKDASFYGIFGLGVRKLIEQNNEGGTKNTDLSIGGSAGFGGQIKLSDYLYAFGEIKTNVGRVMIYDGLIRLNTIGFGGGLKLIF